MPKYEKAACFFSNPLIKVWKQGQNNGHAKGQITQMDHKTLLKIKTIKPAFEKLAYKKAIENYLRDKYTKSVDIIVY